MRKPFGVLTTIVLVSGMAAIGSAEPARGDDFLRIDVALVLAADMSGSVSDDEALLQRNGYAAALESQDVVQVINESPFGRIAVTYIEWSGAGLMQVGVDWTIIENEVQAIALAAHIRAMPMPEPGSRAKSHGTSISHAIKSATDVFETLDAVVTRRIIDISGDGCNNDGSDMELYRQRALRRGIVINGLPIGADECGGETITEYYKSKVIGGIGSFIVPANDLEAFRDAVLKKLVREVG